MLAGFRPMVPVAGIGRIQAAWRNAAPVHPFSVARLVAIRAADSPIMASHTTTAGKSETAKQAEKRLSITVCELVRCIGDLRQSVHFFEQRICRAMITRQDLDGAERRIINAVGGATSLKDKKLLDRLERQSESFTRKLERLAGKTN